MNFEIRLSGQAENDLTAISDQKTRQDIERGLLRLESDPQERGKPLTGDLKGYYSIRLARQRFRNVVAVLVIGIRKDGSSKDVYQIARKRLGKR